MPSVSPWAGPALWSFPREHSAARPPGTHSGGTSQRSAAAAGRWPGRSYPHPERTPHSHLNTTHSSTSKNGDKENNTSEYEGGYFYISGTQLDVYRIKRETTKLSREWRNSIAYPLLCTAFHNSSSNAQSFLWIRQKAMDIISKIMRTMLSCTQQEYKKE